VHSFRRRWAGSLLPLHWLLEAELTPSRDNGQSALQVVVNEMADVVEDPVLRPDLWRT
jgi:hypothetical protein